MARRRWSSEKIELPSAVSPANFRVLAIGASSPTTHAVGAGVIEGVARSTQLVAATIWKA